MGYVSAVPPPRNDAAPEPASPSEPEDAGSRAGRRSVAVALLLGALGATVVLLASGRVWARGTAAIGGGSLPLTADGRAVTGLPAALAIVGLAALVAVFAVRGRSRLLVSALLALSGLGAALAAVATAGDRKALDAEAARTTADTAAQVAGLTHTAWPYITAGGAVLILLAGLLALRFGRSWPAMGGRYERDGSPRPRKAAPVDPDRPEDLWKALDRGEDPTR
ncbi:MULTISPECIES: TIGR02234 family membrane protein [unclassified Streptomyces]|uniref:TIGR02234 family membrane protein n=1 Tax=unclassified Streptomyces TaxID=2593676 RepID=UPI001BE694B5|nr:MULTISPECIES: TIGR02234 family membrane protein [unclassified Streptomyces]MBT2405993.1 TIGR02234 family membrane protein [Streptomyces sp. ISL-21]MBT2453886.1 TIGR02234 family membrane protein [Streptomyces sp. ISL-86]MBT2608589.1 TIGR02234 family membrane protein [Streptomyces sp. ISL-87]